VGHSLVQEPVEMTGAQSKPSLAVPAHPSGSGLNAWRFTPFSPDQRRQARQKLAQRESAGKQTSRRAFLLRCFTRASRRIKLCASNFVCDCLA
jgi:hypothetical protein